MTWIIQNIPQERAEHRERQAQHEAEHPLFATPEDACFPLQHLERQPSRESGEGDADEEGGEEHGEG